ncbi:MAG: AAA-like domain-containing protein [Cyanobacteria bacterium P01_D01_bin.156]
MTEPHDQLLENIEQKWFNRTLSPLEKLVFLQSWQGQSYDKIAQGSGYSIDYMKQIGSVLWGELSRSIDKPITKKNLKLVLEPLLTTSAVDRGPILSTVVASQKKSHRFPSGPLPLDSPLYVERPPTEQLAYEELGHEGCLLRIKAPRRMGKSSLLKRLTWHAQQQGYHIVTLDFQEASQDLLNNTEIFLQWFCRYITQALNLEDNLESSWIPEMGSKVNCKHYIETHILTALKKPLLLSINELNYLFEFPSLARDFLPMLRFWHEQSKDNSLWQKLRMVLVYSTDVYAPLQLKKSPLNVGIPIRLPFFSFEQVQGLSHRFGLHWSDDQYSDLESLYRMIDGHPYLANLAFYYLHRDEITLRELLATACTSDGIYRSHLQELLIALADDLELASIFRTVVESNRGVVLDAISTHKLEGLGLVHFNDGRVQVICNLYRIYFREQLQTLLP